MFGFQKDIIDGCNDRKHYWSLITISHEWFLRGVFKLMFPILNMFGFLKNPINGFKDRNIIGNYLT